MELKKYNLEASNQVRLFFKNGQQKLISQSDLATHLTPIEAEKIRQAFNLRQSYLKALPKWAKLLLISVLAVSVGYGGVKAAPSVQQMLHQVIPAIPAPQAQPVPAVPDATTKAPAAPTAAPEASEAVLPSQPAQAAGPSAKLELPPQAADIATEKAVPQLPQLQLPLKPSVVDRIPF